MAEAIIHHRAFAAFTDALIADDIHEVKQWEADVVSWETDHTKPCPYDRTKTGWSPIQLLDFFLSHNVD